MLVEPELDGDEAGIKKRIAELMAPYSEELLWTEHIAECGLSDCDDPGHMRFRQLAKWDWYVIGGDYDGLIIGDEHSERSSPGGWKLGRISGRSRTSLKTSLTARSSLSTAGSTILAYTPIPKMMYSGSGSVSAPACLVATPTISQSVSTCTADQHPLPEVATYWDYSPFPL